jgi:hypothetical protein
MLPRTPHGGAGARALFFGSRLSAPLLHSQTSTLELGRNLVEQHYLMTMTKSTPKSNMAPKTRPRQNSTTADPTRRKRELDRIAQRNCRERTKNRINFLEAKVRSLEQRDANNQFSSLVATQETLLNESAELRAAMRKILFIAGTMVNRSENNCRFRLILDVFPSLPATS